VRWFASYIRDKSGFYYSHVIEAGYSREKSMGIIHAGHNSSCRVGSNNLLLNYDRVLLYISVDRGKGKSPSTVY
jgi:hypothetical protein